MRGFELQQARRRLREEIIRGYLPRMDGQPYFDLADLHAHVEAGLLAGVKPLIRRLIVRGLASFGLQQGDIAYVLSEDVRNVERWIIQPVLMDSLIGKEIDEEVARLLPETDEPERAVPVTAPLYSSDLVAAARIRALTRGE